MKPRITDSDPDVHALHASHMLFDAFDLHMLAGLAVLAVAASCVLCGAWRLCRSRNSQFLHTKKRE